MSTKTNFQDWLNAKGVDVQSLDRKLRAALMLQYRREQLSLMPPVTRLVVPVFCQWPMRCYRSEVLG